MDDLKETTLQPYVGPRPFTRNDQTRFFGRDREAGELLSLIVANQVVVLYAQSGAGKTSLLAAQVTPLLETEDFEVWPFARVQGPLIESMDPAEINNIYTFYTLLSWDEKIANPAELKNQTIRQYLADRPHTTDDDDFEQPRILIFDQFEELFTAFPARWREREAFFNDLNRALENDPLLRVVFSLREDYVAQLDPYAHLMPQNLRTRFRLERMRAGAALEAIRDPLQATERHFSAGVAERLVEDLRAVRVESITGEITTVTGEFIEPVQLQVVCQNLWEDLPAEVAEITAVHLQTFGNVNQALSAFYERAVARALPQSGMNEEALRRWFEEALITPAGTRGTVYRGATKTGSLVNAAVDILENMHLIRGEFRAGSRWYELTHDRLIEPIQQSNRHWHDQRQQARIKRIRRIAITGVALALFIGICGYGLFFLSTIFDSGDASNGAEATRIGETATAAQVEADDERATAIILFSTATAEATIAAGMATSQYIANEKATATWIAVEAAASETAVAAQETETAVAQAIQDATATAAIANPAATAAAAEATRTAEELDRVRQPVRPLQPGISIGNQNSDTAGTLSAFVVDSQNVFYLLGPDRALGAADATVLQPSPIDGGQPEDAVAVTANLNRVAGINPIDAALLINRARLEPGIAFQTTVPGVGPILGVAEPQLGEEVWVYGRTSGLVSRQISCLTRCTVQIEGIFTVNADFLLNEPLSSGDEGAIIINQEGFALGIVAYNSANEAVAASMTAVLSRFGGEPLELVRAGQQVTPITPRSDAWALATNPISPQLAVGTETGEVLLYDLNTLSNEPMATVGTLPGGITALNFSPDGRFLTAASGTIIYLWDLKSPASENRVLFGSVADMPLETIRDVAISPDNTMLAAAGDDNQVRLWDLIDRDAPAIILTEHDEDVYAVAFSPDGQFLASGGWDGDVHVWALTEPELTHLYTLPHDDLVFDVVFSPDGTRLASASADKTIRLWDLTAADPTEDPLIFDDHADTSRALAFSPDGRYLAAATDETKLIYEWDVTTPEAVPLVLLGHGRRVTAVAYIAGGHLLLSTDPDGLIRIWITR